MTCFVDGEQDVPDALVSLGGEGCLDLGHESGVMKAGAWPRAIARAWMPRSPMRQSALAN